MNNDVSILSLSAEQRLGSAAVATDRPRLSWVVSSTAAGWRQASATLEFTSDRVVRTANLSGAESSLVDWPFEPLAPRQRGTLRVRVTGVDGSTSGWSEPSPVLAAFLPPDGFSGMAIGHPAPDRPAQPVLLRHCFRIEAPVSRAYLYATSEGVHQTYLNGIAVDDETMKPGWVSYNLRQTYVMTEVTDLLMAGENAIGISLAGGWFTQTYDWGRHARRYYGEQPTAAAMLVIIGEDGSERVVNTDRTWLAHPSPVVESSLYAGETTDARQVVPNWASPGLSEGRWTAVSCRPPAITPTPTLTPPTRTIEELPVAAVVSADERRIIVDFGQVLVGRVQLSVTAPAGHEITIRHAEVLEDGELAIRPLRSARATARYIAAGHERETWEPEFTFFGFRYVAIENWPGPFDPASLVARVVHSDMVRTGWFDSSHQLVNQLHENTVWGMRGNFLSIPTDCPQRDERMGWTGDIQVFAPTAARLFDCRAFLTSWLVDLLLEQERLDGVVPFTAPSPVDWFERPAAAWGDAITIVPWTLYQHFGDRHVLARCLPGMQAWTDLIVGLAGPDLLWTGMFQFGDWLDPTAPPEDAANGQTSTDLVATAYLYRSAWLTAQSAEVLGEHSVAVHYAGLAEQIRTAFLTAYMRPDGRLISDSQTAYSLVLEFGLATDPELRAALGDRLAALVAKDGHRIGTGFVGTPLVLDALCSTGHAATAERLLLQTECPSWLYPVTMGATTIWERWDSMRPDGSVNPGEMTSFNHYAFGAVSDWLHHALAGLAPLEPGYRRVAVRPLLLDGFDHASSRVASPYGIAEVRWQRLPSGAVEVVAEIPANTEGVVTLPGRPEFRVGSGIHLWELSQR